ncbi:MAG: polysaccharide biosynthesis C-terminal domain-containing protein [Oliverpabstia sp.]|nr:polysaccharide biosynthesis C-terminal domain-containing protein [Eubacterium sp.]
MEKKMENKNLEVFSNAPVPQAVLKNVLPAMAAMIMVLIYNLADTFFIGQTRNAILIAAVSLAMPVLFLVFMDQILMLVGASPDTMGPAKTYLTIVSLGGIFVIISNYYSNIIRAEGQAGKAMMGQLIGNLLNVVLDPIMILGFGWGIAGAAVATVIGNVFGAVYYILYFRRGNSVLSFCSATVWVPEYGIVLRRFFGFRCCLPL